MPSQYQQLDRFLGWPRPDGSWQTYREGQDLAEFSDEQLLSIIARVGNMVAPEEFERIRNTFKARRKAVIEGRTKTTPA